MAQSPENRAVSRNGFDWRRDFAASMVVFLVALPLCMGIAIASGVPVAAGMVTGIVGGLVVGTLAGSPLQVSGPAAGLTVIIYELVQTHGLESLGIVVLLAGAIQIASGWLKVGVWFRAVSPAVVEGMLAGIGVLIIANQIHVMVDDKPRGTAVQNIASIPEAFRKGLPWPELGTVEQRRAQTQLLRTFGTLHSDQVQVGERVAEIVPHDASVEVAAATRTGLKDIAARQQEIAERLEVLLSDFQNNPAIRAANGRFDEVQGAIASAIAAAKTAQQDLGEESGANVRKSQEEAAQAILEVERSLKNHDWAAKLGFLTIVVLLGWSFFRQAVLKAIPAPVVAILAATAATVILALPVMTVEIPENLLNDLHAPSLTVLQQLDWPGILLAAAVVAAVASAETLLCCTAVDQLQTRVQTNYDRELVAQGVGNMTCGLLGALPMTGVIVRSSANVRSGATSRLSAILHGVWLLVMAWWFSGLLRAIPTSSLAAMLVYTGFKLVNVSAIRELWRVGKGEVFVYAVTLVTIVVEDLLTGVVVGIVVAAGRLLMMSTRFHAEVRPHAENGGADLYLRGAGTFVRLPKLLDALEQIPSGCQVRLHVEELTHLDHAGQQALLNWLRRHVATGGELKVSWEALRIRGRIGDAMIEEYRVTLTQNGQPIGG